MSQDALLNHLLARIRSDVQFLQSQNALQPGAEAAILAQLPADAAAVQRAQLGLGHGQQAAHRAVPPPPTVNGAAGQEYKALWDYAQVNGQPDDLPFRQGDILIVTDKVSQDWWRGRFNGREGLFPSNYVELVASRFPAPTPSPVPSYHATPHQQQSWQAPQQQSWQPPPPAFSPPTGDHDQSAYHPISFPNDSKQGTRSMPGAPPIPAKKNSQFGKDMGKAFAGGAGFGAGAAAGSAVINAIF